MDKVTELIQATASGNLERVKELIASGCNPSSRNVDNRTPLHLAASEGHLEIVKFLIEDQKVEVNVRDRHGVTPLGEAIASENNEIVEYLKSHGGAVQPESSGNELCEAVASGDLNKVKELIAAGADINAPDHKGSTALHIAASKGHTEIANELIKSGAQINITNRWGYTPLQDAIRKNNKEVAELLRQNGAIVADINKYKNSDYFLNSLRKTVNLLAEKDGWNYSGAWIPNGENLKPLESWYSSSEHVNKLAPFRQAIENITVNIDSESLVGRSFKSKKPEYTDSEEKIDYLDETIVKEAGFKSSLSIPVLYNDEVFAIIEFRSFNVIQLSDDAMKEYISIASRMVVGTIRSEEGMTTSFLRGVFADQINTVYELISKEKIFCDDLVRKEVEWFYHGLGLNEFYFDHFPPQEIAKHVISFIAAKIHAKNTGTEEVVRFRSEDKNSALYIGPPEDSVEIERRIESTWLGEGYAGSSPLEPGYAPSVKYFLSQGTASSESKQRLAIYIVSTGTFVQPVVDENECDIWKIATGQFLREKSYQARSRYQSAIEKASQRMGPYIFTSRPTQRENTPRDGTVLTVVYKRGSTHSFFSSISSYLARNNIHCTRKYIEAFSNGYIAYSFHIRGIEKHILEILTAKASLLWILPRTSLSKLVDENKLTVQEVIYAYSGWKFAYHFLTRSSDEFTSLWETFSDNVDVRTKLLKLKKKIRNEIAPEERIKEIIFEHHAFIKELFEDFRKGFEPRLDGTKPERPVFNEELWKKMNKSVISPVDLAVLRSFLTFNSHILKTNFFKAEKTAISYRLDPTFLKEGDHSTIPYGLFLIIGAEFRGFHIRFDDVARGGIRLIRSGNKQIFLRNAETLFDENYNLAFTQQKKNKDIPEGGSKGTVFLSVEHQDKGHIAFSKYIDALLDLLLPSEDVIDYYGKEEIIFCGPDEGTAGFMDWAALHAKKRGYAYWSAFTTGKSPKLGGIPHDTYGMTTNSVHQYVLGVIEKLGLKEEELTKCQTGGPDGDLGSNEIKISKDKTIAIVDGSGVLYDPDGLDREELLSLANRRVMSEHFDKSKLGPKGFFVSINDVDVTLPDGRVIESGMNFRNTFHLDELFTADLFVPCGGRPEAINISNVDKLFANGKPKFKYIIEGANLFISQEARIKLEEAGVVLIKDSSTNKGGVTSSSLEVLAALSTTEEEHKKYLCVAEDGTVPEFYKKYVEDNLVIIRENARKEFECIWNESKRTGIHKCVISDIISERINELNFEIRQNALWEHNEELKKTLLREVLPKSLQDLIGLDRIIERLPKSHIDATLAAYLASRYIYEHGITPNTFSFYNFMKKYNA